MRKSAVLGPRWNVCIYCRQDSSDSVAQAHVFPDAIIRNEVMLPLGTECDRCNRFASKLEQALLGHNRIAVPIMLRGVPGKNGPRKQIGSIKRNEPEGKVSFTAPGRVVSFTAGRLDVEMPDVAPLDAKRFRRALHHIALNHIALIGGPEAALDPRFDAARAYVRLGDPKVDWPYAQYMYPDVPVGREMGCRWFRWESGTIIQIRTFADDFYVDLDNSGMLPSWANRTLPRGVGVL